MPPTLSTPSTGRLPFIISLGFAQQLSQRFLPTRTPHLSASLYRVVEKSFTRKAPVRVPLAMAIYAVAVTPLIRRLGQACPSVVQSWYADDDSAADTLASLRHYWDTVKEVGPGYGYYPNPTKTVLVTKPEHFSTAQEIFQHTGVAIKSDGARYLGGALGSVQYREACVTARANQ